ncbi:MAG: 3'-5' exonuclease, partial [Gemmatimonadales bacterium]
VLAVRHPRSIERSLANLDAFLALSRAWDTKGLKAFADELRRRRDEGAKQAEGRPDLGSNAVSIVTMHSAKGLEWPVVVPINMGTVIKNKPTPVASCDGLLLSVLGAAVRGYAEANQAESEERARERLRLLYVADTRARDLLVLPRHSVEGTNPAWCKLCRARTLDLSSFDLTAFELAMPLPPESTACLQTDADFAANVARIAAAQRILARRTPSRHDEGDELEIVPEVVAGEDKFPAVPVVKGGRDRGRILHKLIEEILTGEIAEADLERRAGELIHELGAEGKIEVEEAGGTVRRTLALPEILELRLRLMAEVDVTALSIGPGGEELTVGIADALAVTADGDIDVVIDWKSDVAPEPAILDRYRYQMADYLRSVRAQRGLIVLMTPGRVIEIAPVVE